MWKPLCGETMQRLENPMQQLLPSIAQPPKSTSSMAELLNKNPHCFNTFGVVCKVHTESVLYMLEHLFIQSLKPDLCKQMDVVKCLHLFSSTWALTNLIHAYCICCPHAWILSLTPSTKSPCCYSYKLTICLNWVLFLVRCHWWTTEKSIMANLSGVVVFLGVIAFLSPRDMLKTFLMSFHANAKKIDWVSL